jgi:hypothetical protein
MRSFRAAPAALASSLAAVLTVTLAVSVAAAPSYAEPERTALPAQASDRAEQALATAQAVLAGRDEGIEPSTALRELFLLQDELEGEDRERAAQVLARPDGQSPGSDWDYAWRPRDEARPLCNARVCVHYVTSGEHAATYRQAKATLATMARSWRVEVGVLGYRAPRKDGYRGNRRWADSKGKTDVYLMELSSMGAFGYAVPERDPAGSDDGNPGTTTGYLVMDQDFAEYGPRPAAYRKVTAAHELFHLVQYAYRVMGESGRWFMESTATWMEERVYDGVNDNRAYVQYSQLAAPHQSLNTTNGATEYGNWLLHEYYTQRKGNVLVRRAWWHVGRGRHWRAALISSLRSVRWGWPAMYAEFAALNNFPARAYSEGWAYRSHVATPQRTGASQGGSGTLRPYSSGSFRFFPGYDGGLLGGDTTTPLTLVVDLEPGKANRAYVVVQLAGGGIRRHWIPVDETGHGARRFPFAEDDVRHVTLTLVNASPASRSVSFQASNG